ncbi:MAG: endonuclease/exonuclease/phosphatase family protein [Kiritimatiellae bacterium]|nr:endonuclease/exonuclease/phosphatase family protein [Kiritimatiellia bacterium]
MRCGLLLLAFFLTPAAWLPAADSNRTSLVVASWNVENLFDADDDPDNPGDDEYTPRGWTRWTEARYRLKLAHVADVVARMQPDILCLAEVENHRVLDDLTLLLRRQHGLDLPAIIHRDCGDQRGIDTAILARQTPAAVDWLTPLREQRHVIIAEFGEPGRRLTVMANHWKSRYGKKSEADAARTIEARAVRAELDRRLKANPSAAIIVAGDLNDDIDGAIPQACAGFVLDEGAVLADGRLLYNLSAALTPEARGTYYYNQGRRWNSFDSMSVSRGLLPKGVPPSPWRVRAKSYGAFSIPEMRMAGSGAPLPFRRVRTRAGSRVYDGYSDHFPIKAIIEMRP